LKTEHQGGQKRSSFRGRRIGVYPGQYYDPETGLHYNYFRYYNPQTGRYITPDPIGLEGGVNLFSYVVNNPMNLIDPFGLKEWIYIPAGIGFNLKYFSFEFGTYYLIDPSTGEYYQFGYSSGGLGLGFGGAAQLEAGTFEGPCDPTKISSWSLAASGFTAAGIGLSGQITGTSFWGQGEGGATVGIAGGWGAGISGMVTYSGFLQKGNVNVLPEKIYKTYQYYRSTRRR
jgi:RHS repeat-associated protein